MLPFHMVTDVLFDVLFLVCCSSQSKIYRAKESLDRDIAEAKAKMEAAKRRSEEGTGESGKQ